MSRQATLIGDPMTTADAILIAAAALLVHGTVKDLIGWFVVRRMLASARAKQAKFLADYPIWPVTRESTKEDNP